MKVQLAFWCCSWARLVEGVCGIVSLGFWMPLWGLRTSEFFARKFGANEDL